jgi:hypothetical protein
MAVREDALRFGAEMVLPNSRDLRRTGERAPEEGSELPCDGSDPRLALNWYICRN